MSRVHVVVFPTENEESDLQLDGSDPRLHKYVSWIPVDYLAEQLKQDVGRYWLLKTNKYELCDSLGNELPDDKPLELSNLHPAVLEFKRRERTTPVAAKVSSCSQNASDPFYIHDQLFDLFVFNALQNRPTSTLRITSFQFKQILQKATSKTVYQQKKKLFFDKRVTLAFRGARSNLSSGDGIAGANFDEFLDALVDVACFMNPKESSKEASLEKLATEHIIPYHEVEQFSASTDTLSWGQIDELMAREKLKLVAQRFSKTIGDLATSYSPNVGHNCVLGYHEFQKFVRDVIPTTVPISSTEACKVFMRYCRIEQTYEKGKDKSTGPRTEYTKEELPVATRNSLSSLGAPVLEITCAKTIDVIMYIALVAVPRLVKTKEKVSGNCANIALTSKLGVQSLKALLHHISNNLGAHRGALVRKNVDFNRARAHFLLEFNKMHRDDSLTDYQSGCAVLLKTLKAQVPQKPTTNSAPIASQNEEPAKPDDKDFDSEFNWNLDAAQMDDVESPAYDGETSANSPVSRTSFLQVDPQPILQQRKQELEQLNAISNEADEIYAFLAGELQRHALSKRSDGPDTVPHMLDVWVSAGENYSDVINHVESSAQLRATFLTRFGRSLYVFASQVLKSTTKVYCYEEHFYVTNARVYSTSSDLWRDGSNSFTLDLAMETLSLASGKLTQASEELSALVVSSRETDDQSEDDISSTGSSGSQVGEETEAWTASALFDKYRSCLYLRANCLAAYADVIAHNKKVTTDYDVACRYEESKQLDEANTPKDDFFTSTIVLSKASPPIEFYWEAKKMYRFLLQHSKGGLHFSRSRLHHNLAMVQFKLATHLPRGCDIEKQLLENSLLNLDACERSQDKTVEQNVLKEKRNYIRAVLAARRKFFLTENSVADGENRDEQHEQDEIIAPFYRFVLAAAFVEFDSDKKGVLLQPELTRFSKACGHNSVSADSLQWLLENFDHVESGLTERGVMQYFCWLAEADPVAFCEIIDLLTAKHTGAHNVSIFSGDCLYPRKLSTVKSTSTSRKPTVGSSTERDRLRAKRTGVADCLVVLGGKMTKAAGVDVSCTTSPSDIRLEPEVIDMLPSRASLPEELSKFCFPDDMHLTTEPFSPRTFDIVLTDIKGVRSYGSCLHFCEEKHPMDVLSLISATEKGRTVDLPSWVSLKDIQQGQTKWKSYAPKCLCVLSSSPLFQTFQNFLIYLYRLSLTSSSSFSLEAIVFNFLERTPLPTANLTQTVFKLGDTTCLLSGFPPHLPLFSPTEVDFTILFQCLNPDNILKVYGYLLAEKKVVLSSANRPILTHVAETLRALLHPFECQQVYIPVLPLSLIEFICAPVPFFMGIRSDHRLERLMAEGVILVDLDNNDIRLPPNEELPILADVKSRKLLHTLRKLSSWPASQRTRHNFGNGNERPIPTSFEPVQPSESQVEQVINRHDDLAEKWSEIQTLFASFATRLLKDIRKHCTKAPTSANNSVVFDERSFLAMHPSLRDFCTHLFQTQLFQRSLENIGTVCDTSSTTEPEQYWRAVRAKGMLRKNSEINEDAVKSQRRRVIQAPLPPRKSATLASCKAVGGGFPTFNGQLYDNLLDELSDFEELESSACDVTTQLVRPLSSVSSLRLSSETSSTSVLTSPSFLDGDIDAFQLVNAARKRLEGRRTSEAVE